MRLEGEVALISGAARGQGETEAKLFAQEGASVVLGLALFITVLAVNLIGDGLRDALDPKIRRRA